MDVSRRELAFLFPALAMAAGQEQPPGHLGSHVYHPDQSLDLAGKEKKGGRIFYGIDHSGFALEMHQTELAPGVESHPPHKHVHEEIMVVLDGKLQTNVEGKTEIAERGSVVYFGSNQMHNVRNAGQVPVRYYVLELRGREA
jgi:quercetin dioxygenase-like cupin family protein